MGLDRAIDITAEQRKTIVALLARHLPNTAAWVYGSRAKWTSRPQSDLDLVVFATPEQHRKVSDLREAFEESSLPFRVDLFVWDGVPEQFRKQIEADHVVLVESLEAKSTQDSDWQTTRWGELASLEYGKAFRNYKSSTGPYRVFGTNGPIGWHDEVLYAHSGVIIGRKGAYRGVHYSARPFFVIDTAFYLKPKAKMDTRWAYYQLLGQNINDLDSGSAIPSTRREDFYNLPVKVPPLPEQRAIAHVLGTLDDKIELNRRMNETLEEMARALFKSWFVDFLPVRAKMEGRNTGLPKHLADLFPDRLVDSELGEIPEGWVADKLGSYVKFQNGYAFKSSDWQSNGVPVVKIGSVKPGLVDLTATSYVSPDTVIGLERFKLNPGDILVGMTGYPGETGLVPMHDPCPYLNQRVGRISAPQQHPENYAWIYAQVRNSSFKAHAVARSQGSAQANVSGRALLEYPVVFPGKALLKHYSDLVSLLISSYIANDANSRTLTALRDALLPKLISGELRVRKIAKCPGEVAWPS